LESSKANTTIFYTINGSDPDTSSTQYDGSAIVIAETTTLKFTSVDPDDNHTTSIVTEIYVIDTVQPVVTDTSPHDGERKVNIFSLINATFSKPVNGSTVTTDTFLVTNEVGDPVSGTVSYDEGNNTATFTPDEPLIFGLEYAVDLTDGIKDSAENSLEPHGSSFVTSGQIRIFVRDIQSFDLIGGSVFTITPNPFTLEDSLIVEDNGVLDVDATVFGNLTDGIIVVDNVENAFTTYRVTETTVPTNYSKIWGDVTVTVVQALACDSCDPVSSITVDNLRSDVSITDVDTNISVPAPYLDQAQFDLYSNNVIVGRFQGVQGDVEPTIGPIQSPSSSSLPAAQIATSTTIDDLLAITIFESLNFVQTASPSLTGSEIFESFIIPKYPAPVEDIAGNVTYAVPAAVIPYEGSKNNFVLSPVIEKVFPGEQLLIIQPSVVETEVARVQRINMTFNILAENVGFSFGISNSRPSGTPPLPGDTPALFLDVGVVGNADFSDSSAFESSPKIDILVNKTLPGFEELEDGCSDFELFIFDEEEGEWRTVSKLRNTEIDTSTECGFTLEPGHFSTFAVGGVKGNILVTDVVLGSVGGGGGRGGSSSTSIQQMVSGGNVLVTTDVGTATVISRFEFVEPGSGQLKIESGPITDFEDLFDEVVNLSEGSQKQGIVRLSDAEYSTVGTIFDIDTTDVNFRGTYDITIPYKEDIVSSSLGSESNIRFLHYNTELEQWEDLTIFIDQGANTVTGRMNSSSPVVAALMIPIDNPTKKLRMSDVTILDPVTNLERLEVTKGEPVTVTVMLEYMVPSSSDGQTFVFIVEVLDENGMAIDISVQNGTLDGRNRIQLTRSWTENAAGWYTMKIFVWTDIEEPAALSDVATTQVRVSE
jgi:hypothetical protein